MALLGGGLGGVVDGLLGGGSGGSGGGGLLSGVLGGVLGAGSGNGGVGGGLVDGLLGGDVLGQLLGNGLNTDGLLDGLARIELFEEGALLRLGILPDPDGDGLVDLSLLNTTGGLVGLDVLDDALGLDLLDTDGDGLINLSLLDVIQINIDLDGDLDGDGVPDDSTDPDDYDVVQMGTARPDQFVIGAEKTYIDGLAGIDTASYGASAAGFTYAVGANGIHLYDGTKVDYLQSVERVKFSDGTLALDTGIGENTGMAYRIYQAAFDREPDVGGLKFWLDKIDSGTDMHSVASDFLFSREFQQTYGNLTNQDYIEELYQNILQRAGESAGITYWTQQLNSGSFDRAQVLVGFSESSENVELTGTVIADGVFLA